MFDKVNNVYGSSKDITRNKSSYYIHGCFLRFIIYSNKKVVILPLMLIFLFSTIRNKSRMYQYVLENILNYGKIVTSGKVGALETWNIYDFCYLSMQKVNLTDKYLIW